MVLTETGSLSLPESVIEKLSAGATLTPDDVGNLLAYQTRIKSELETAEILNLSAADVQKFTNAYDVASQVMTTLAETPPLEPYGPYPTITPEQAEILRAASEISVTLPEDWVSQIPVVAPEGGLPGNITVITPEDLPKEIVVVAPEDLAGQITIDVPDNVTVTVIAPEDLPENIDVIVPDDLPHDIKVIVPEDLVNEISITAPEGLLGDIAIVVPDNLTLPREIRVLVPSELPGQIDVIVPEDLPSEIVIVAPEDLAGQITIDVPDDVTVTVVAPEDLPENIDVIVPDDLPHDIKVIVPEDLVNEISITAPEGLLDDIAIVVPDNLTLPREIRVLVPSELPGQIDVIVPESLPGHITITIPEDFPLNGIPVYVPEGLTVPVASPPEGAAIPPSNAIAFPTEQLNRIAGRLEYLSQITALDVREQDGGGVTTTLSDIKANTSELPGTAWHNTQVRDGLSGLKTLLEDIKTNTAKPARYYRIDIDQDVDVESSEFKTDDIPDDELQLLAEYISGNVYEYLRENTELGRLLTGTEG